MSSARCWSPPVLTAGGACADLAARAERAAGLRGHRRRHRSARDRARPPYPGDHPQRRHGGHHPARPAHRTGARPGHWRPHRRADLPGLRWAPAGPARRRADRAAGGPPAGITKTVGPHTLRHAFITAALDAGSRCGMSRKPLPTLTHAPQCAMTGPAPRWTAPPPTSSSPTSPEPPGRPFSNWYLSAWPDSGQADHHRKHRA
jgi:hypothetical protein